MNKQTKIQKTRKDQAEERRIQILDVALEVFAASGFAGTSIKDIAGAAGISQGLMYHYFPSKQALLGATIEYHGFLPQLRQLLQNNKERPIKEVITEIAENFLTLLDSKRSLVKLLISEIEVNQEVRKAWADICREGSSLLQQYLESHIEKGELRRHNTEVTARMVFNIIFMYHFTEDVFTASKLSRREFINEALANILRGAGGV
jgi:AcrR family transcriptional regulator